VVLPLLKRGLLFSRPVQLPDSQSNQQGQEKTGWPRRVQALKEEDVETPGVSVSPLVLRLDGRDQPGAYRADWAPDYMGPQTHYGYATQWFSLALALVILTVAASYRKTGNDNDDG
jgi:cytochrome oxidase assembly protein ShyY1